MTDLEKALTIKCFGKFAEQVARDPDPEGAHKLHEEWDCAHCGFRQYCQQLEDTLGGGN